jgi:trimeric autotransporter adhesin
MTRGASSMRHRMSFMRAFRLVVLTWLTLLVVAGCGGGGGSPTPAPAQGGNGTSPVKSLSVDPPAGSSLQNTAAVGSRFQVLGTAILADGTKEDLTSSLTWTSSNTAVATIDATGTITPISAGTTVITATAPSGVTGSFTLTVTGASLASIGITPALQSTPAGFNQQLTATGTYTDGTTQDLTTSVTWTSASPAVATISNVSGTVGLVTGVSPGSSSITAALSGVTGSSNFNVTSATLVSLAVTPAASSLAKGTQVQFHVTGTYSDGSTQDLTGTASWSSSDSSIVSIGTSGTNAGLVTALNTGNATITSTLGGVTSSTQLSATPATLVSIAVTPAIANVAAGNTVQLAAVGTYSDNTTQALTSSAVWSSSAPGVATVSNVAGHEGLATSIAQGTSTISATSGGVTGTVGLNVSPAVLQSIAVSPSASTIVAGLNDQVLAVGTYSDNTTQDLTTVATWTTSNGTVASVSNAAGSKGLLSALTAGPVSVAASVGGVSGAANVTVSSASIASVAITPATPSVAAGLTQQLTATATLVNLLTLDVTLISSWSSSNPAVATIASTGVVTGVSPGTVTVTAALLTGQTTTATVTVTAATLTSMALSPTNPSVSASTSQQLTATGTFSDGSTSNITASTTYTSGTPAVATVSNAPGSNGLVSALTPGTAVITATKGSVTTTTTVTVTSSTRTLTSITVTPANVNLLGSVVSLLGANTQFTATGNYSDGTTQNLTNSVQWATSQSSLATVNSSGQMQLTLSGLLALVGLGQNTLSVSATSGSVTGSTQITLTVL